MAVPIIHLKTHTHMKAYLILTDKEYEPLGFFMRPLTNNNLLEAINNLTNVPIAIDIDFDIAAFIEGDTDEFQCLIHGRWETFVIKEIPML